MKSIKLNRGRFALVDDDLFDEINQFKWYAVPSGVNWYAIRNGIRKGAVRQQVRMHAEIYRVSGMATMGECIDHIDHDGLNNQRHNLRIATKAQNCQNKRIMVTNTSGYVGVTWNKKSRKWQSQLKSNGKSYHLGFFESVIDAAIARDAKAEEVFGSFAFLNFPKHNERRSHGRDSLQEH